MSAVRQNLPADFVEQDLPADLPPSVASRQFRKRDAGDVQGKGLAGEVRIRAEVDRQVLLDVPELTIEGDEPFILHPGEFVLGSTLERVALREDPPSI